MIESIKIGGIAYPVNIVPNLHDGDKKLDGEIYYTPPGIALAAGLGKQGERVILWHEILHGILTHSGRTDVDEGIIEALSYGIAQVIQDNPRLAG